MIRIRSAFLITLIAIALAFAVGLQAGYFASRSATLVRGMERWVEEIKTYVPSINRTKDGGQ
jgi:ABC-type proline/glycine betaine transport system permease subunit